MAGPSAVSNVNSSAPPRRARVNVTRSLAKYHAEKEQKAKEKRNRQREVERAYEDRRRVERNERLRLYQQRLRAQFLLLPPDEQAAIRAKKNQTAATSHQNNRVRILNAAQLRRVAQNPNLLPRRRQLNCPEDYSDEQRELHARRNEWKTHKRLSVRHRMAVQDGDSNAGAEDSEEGDGEDETDSE